MTSGLPKLFPPETEALQDKSLSRTVYAWLGRVELEVTNLRRPLKAATQSIASLSRNGGVHAVLGADTTVPISTPAFALTNWTLPAGYTMVPPLEMSGFAIESGQFRCLRDMVADLSAQLRANTAVAGTSYTLNLTVVRGASQFRAICASSPGGTSLGLSISPFRFALKTGDLVGLNVDNNSATTALTVNSITSVSGTEVARTWLMVKERVNG